MIGVAGIQSYLKQVAGKLRGAFGPSKDDAAAVRRNGEWEEWNPRIALGQRLWLAGAIGANPPQATLGPWGHAIDQAPIPRPVRAPPPPAFSALPVSDRKSRYLPRRRSSRRAGFRREKVRERRSCQPVPQRRVASFQQHRSIPGG